MELVDFLRARLDEDEATARNVPPDAVASMARKFAADARSLKAHLAEGKSDRIQYDEGQVDALHWASVVLPERMPPLNLWDPARVLDEVEAKRAIVDLYAAVAEMDREDSEPEYAYGRAAGLGEAVRRIARPYRTHPDFDPAWLED